ncbi:Cryptochrome-2 [Nymphaea thermarum]|nr:Cryptochrome-2 [Nymphaea thermarum]
MGTPCKSVVWFRRDLRVEDNPALAAAARAGSILPVYIWCPKEEGQFIPGRVSRWWLTQSLLHLDQSLKSLGARLVMIKAEDSFEALVGCARAVGANQVVYNHLYDPISIVRDHKLKQKLAELGIRVHSFNADLLYEPWEVHDETGHAFTTFEAYWSKCMNMSTEPITLLPPRNLVLAAGTVQSSTIEELGLEDESEKSSNALLSRGWSPGWSNADNTLDEFLSERLKDYSIHRQKVEGATTSLLSPYIHFGELSIRKVYQRVRMKQVLWVKEGNSSAEESVNFFLRSIGLREYSRYICFNFPFTYEKSLMENLRHFPWRYDEGLFKLWRQGRTGYPLVDAGMRELWATGWIHNRIRVTVSSFCVKFLQLPWTWGMKYFWDTLLDADLESDILGWQYISGSLPDGHELDRMDEPEVQGCKYDPEGEYVRHWLPELARLPTEWIHHPWDAPASVLRAAGVELGHNYPRPVVDITLARECLMTAISMMDGLDAAAQAAKMNGMDEGVADNSCIVAETTRVPRVLVKRNVSPSSSSQDQKVPTFHINQGCPDKHHVLVNDGDKVNQTYLRDQCKPGSSRMDEDLKSTAESSSMRKRSISSSECVVPPSYSPCSSNEINRREPSATGESSSTHSWSEKFDMDADTADKVCFESVPDFTFCSRLILQCHVSTFD